MYAAETMTWDTLLPYMEDLTVAAARAKKHRPLVERKREGVWY